MSATLYNKAFTGDLSHDYFTTANKSKVNASLEIAPTKECAELFKQGRMRYVRTPAGFTVFYQAYVDSVLNPPVQKPLVKLSGAVEFMFAVKMHSDAMPLMLNVTELNVNSQTYGPGKILLLDKSVSSPFGGSPPYVEDLDASLIDQLRPSVFTYTFLPDTPTLVTDLTVNIYPEGSGTPILIITPVLVNPQTGLYSVEIDLSKKPKGLYTIKAKDGVTVEHTATVYVDSLLARENIFGLIRVKYTDADKLYETCTNKAKFCAFTYSFEARSVMWRYFVAVKSPSNYFTAGHKLEIVDSLSTYTFDVLDGPFQPSSYKLNGFNTVGFTSDAAIPFSETAIDRFSLNQITVDAKTLITPLQNAIPTGVDSNRANSGGGPFAEIFIVLDDLS
jgi:hypothetical protein